MTKTTENFTNNILTWDSYDDFSSFCSKIGILFNDNAAAKHLFDHVRAQQHLPVINLDHSIACVEHLHALRF